MEPRTAPKLSGSALLSISCGIKDKFVLQVFKKEVIGNRLRLFLSDGCTMMCAETDFRPNYKPLKENSLVRVEVRYTGMEFPLQIISLEIIQADYNYLFGSPVPFVDFINLRPTQKATQETSNGTYRSNQASPDSETRQRRAATQPLLLNSQPRTGLQVQDIDRYLDGSNSRMSSQHQQNDDEYSRISELYPKMRCWKLLARVTWLQYKVCSISKGVKSGQKVPVINFFIVDTSGEIKCCMFDEAATKFKEVLKRHGVYEFSSGTLIEEVQKEGAFHQKQNHLRKGLSIRFESYSKIVEKTGAPESTRLPLVTYRLAGFDGLRYHDANTQLDVAGIIKAVLQREAHISDKTRMSFLLADPFMKKELEVALFLEQGDAKKIEVGLPVVIKNVKITSKDSANNLLFLRGGYNTQLVTEFPPDDDYLQRLQKYSKEHMPKGDFESMSELKFIRRSIADLMNIVSMDFIEESICSRLQQAMKLCRCYFTGVSDERRFTYQACYKCNKKINLVNRLASHCPKCNKIVDVKEQFLLQCRFADYTDEIRISLMGDHAKKFVKMEPQEFSAMTHPAQCAKIRKLEWTEVCLLVRSSRSGDNYLHSVYGVQPATIDSNLERIRRFVQEQVKEEDAF